MINKYYTKKLLFELLKIINKHITVERRAILQKDNDLSHDITDRYHVSNVTLP